MLAISNSNQQCTEDLCQRNRKNKNKDLRIESEAIKLSLFTVDIIVHKEDPK